MLSYYATAFSLEDYFGWSIVRMIYTQGVSFCFFVVSAFKSWTSLLCETCEVSSSKRLYR
uniref:Uncharacterized protein n=1 Tax=Physcomitrium patens TaxID=3218 RepID=A0A2K1L6R3_PHYPA|nr:hypothetical protein PHYPA_000148 [Physcomitrium patens]